MVSSMNTASVFSLVMEASNETDEESIISQKYIISMPNKEKEPPSIVEKIGYKSTSPINQNNLN